MRLIIVYFLCGLCHKYETVSFPGQKGNQNVCPFPCINRLTVCIVLCCVCVGKTYKAIYSGNVKVNLNATSIPRKVYSILDEVQFTLYFIVQITDVQKSVSSQNNLCSTPVITFSKAIILLQVKSWSMHKTPADS